MLDFVRENHGAWTLVVLFLAAALEYMIPPLPADSVVLAGSLLVLAGAWPLPVVAAVAIAGGMVGALSHYQLGRVLGGHGKLRGGRLVERLTGKGTIERFFVAFRRWGVWVIAVNRFFPGIRSVTFIAAGAARLPLGATMALGFVSSVMWTAALLALGLSVGGNWEKIEAVFAVYSKVAVLGSVALIATFVIVRRVRSRRRVIGSPGDEP